MAAFAHSEQGNPSNCPVSADRITARIGWISVTLNSLPREQFGQLDPAVFRVSAAVGTIQTGQETE